MLTIDEVKHLAELARLQLADEELSTFQKELSSILDYFEKLKEVETDSILPTAYALENKNVFREDEERGCDEETINKMIKAMPDKKERYLKVKTIIKV